MSKTDPTVYKADLHTRAKHDILQEYLRRWSLILSQATAARGSRGSRLLYIDGFAGAGEYVGEVPGSPVVAIDTFRASGVEKAAVPVEVVLIEKRADRVQHLKGIVDRLRTELGHNATVVVRDPIKGDCQTVVERLIEEAEQAGQPFGPCFAFLDQFGYGEFSIDLIRRILLHKRCETLSFMNWRMMHPWFTDPDKVEALRRGFGGDAWRELIPLSGDKRSERAKELYEVALRDRCKAEYVHAFTMRGADDQIAYWLFFCTNNIRGLEEMKNAMWKVDESGGFTFSDKHGDSPRMFRYSEADLERDLDREFRGREVTVRELHKWVLTKTPACRWKRCVGNMESKKMVRTVDPALGRTARSYTDLDLRLAFVAPPPVQTSFGW